MSSPVCRWPLFSWRRGFHRWQESEALARSAGSVEEDQRLTKTDPKEISEEVYAGDVSASAQSRQNANRLREKEVQENWLIQLSDRTDDTASGEWKPRNIRGRSTVIVGEPPQVVNWMEFRRLQLQRRVSVMNCKLGGAREKAVSIDRNDCRVPWTEQYDQETGLQL